MAPFTSHGTLVIEYACAGSGALTIQSVGSNLIDTRLLSGCGSGSGSITAPGDAKDIPFFTGKSFTLQVVAGASMQWEVYVGQLLTP
ncbi:MAG: hypothetical protein JOZ92_06975 [Candidatus Dormibacteraeota bacterium]|nr:hypothetical protein [Candidatus Dormibacteraeota bacterium]